MPDPERRAEDGGTTTRYELIGGPCDGQEFVLEPGKMVTEPLSMAADMAGALSASQSIAAERLALLKDAEAEVARLRARLAEIAKGEGPFSLDQYQHACNTIESMKAIAIEALKGSPA